MFSSNRLYKSSGQTPTVNKGRVFRSVPPFSTSNVKPAKLPAPAINIPDKLIIDHWRPELASLSSHIAAIRRRSTHSTSSTSSSQSSSASSSKSTDSGYSESSSSSSASSPRSTDSGYSESSSSSSASSPRSTYSGYSKVSSSPSGASLKPTHFVSSKVSSSYASKPTRHVSNSSYIQRNSFNKCKPNQPFKPRPSCTFCKQNREPYEFYSSHNVKDRAGNTTCPILFKYICEICGATGPNSHTRSYCPMGRLVKDSLVNYDPALHYRFNNFAVQMRQ